MGNSDFVKNIIISGIIIFVGFCVIAYGKSKTAFYDNCLVTTGEVVKIEPIYYGITFGENENKNEFGVDFQLKYGTDNYKKNRADKYKLIAKYYVGGAEYTVEKISENREHELTIRYDPDNPSDCIAETKLSTIPHLIPVVGVIIIFAGIIKFIFYIVISSSNY